MKLIQLMILFSFLSCFAQKKLKIETIISKTTTVTRVNPETGKQYTTSKFVEVTERFHPSINIKTEENNALSILLEGNITSAGLSCNRIKKIRYVKGKPLGDTITLKYYVEIKNIPGKESAGVNGYNYRKLISYKIPKDIKVVKVELYEDRISLKQNSKIPKIKLVAEDIFKK
jgi:hypothetical protein